MQVLARQSLKKRPAAAESVAPAFEIRRLQTFVDEVFPHPAADFHAADRTIAIAVTIVNPHAKRYSDEIDDLFAIGAGVGKLLGRKFAAQNPDFAVVALGKAAIVGQAGELEHAVGLTGAGFDAAVQQSLHLGRGNMPADRRLAAPRSFARVPLAPVASDLGRLDDRDDRDDRDDQIVELCFGSGPRDDEAIVVLAVSGRNRG
jgi:hypothetical protein